MRLGYVTRVVDEDSKVLATQVRWIRSLASKERVESLIVLAGRVGRATLPGNVEIREFGADRWRLLRFMLEATRARASVDAFFIAQGGPFPALLLPLKLGNGPRVYQWKAHAVVSSRMEFYARHCDDLVFTSAPSSFPLEIPGRRVVGQGIDCDLFQPPTERAPDRDLLCFGRMSPIKGVESAISLVASIRDQLGTTRHLDIVGPGKNDYLASLRALADRLGVTDQVHFAGAVPHYELPALLPRYRASLNFSKGALDKTILESMAVGVPVLTSNEAALESMSGTLARELAVDPTSPEDLVDKVEGILRLNEVQRGELAARLRRMVVEDHSLERLFDKILDEIEGFEGKGAASANPAPG